MAWHKAVPGKLTASQVNDPGLHQLHSPRVLPYDVKAQHGPFCLKWFADLSSALLLQVSILAVAVFRDIVWMGEGRAAPLRVTLDLLGRGRWGGPRMESTDGGKAGCALRPGSFQVLGTQLPVFLSLCDLDSLLPLL